MLGGRENVFQRSTWDFLTLENRKIEHRFTNSVQMYYYMPNTLDANNGDRIICVCQTFVYYIILYYMFFLNRWFRNPSGGGLFETAAMKKEMFLRTFWSQWMVAGRWRMYRWAEWEVALLGIIVNRFHKWHFLPFTHSKTLVPQWLWTCPPDQQRWKPGCSTKVSPNCE